MNKEYVYQVLYCECIYESSHATLSLHKTLKGAYAAMKEHRLRNFWEWRESANIYRSDFKDTFAKNWAIEKIEIQP